MAMQIVSINAQQSGFGARVTGLDISSASESEIKRIEAAMDHYAVLVFPDQVINDDEQLAFSNRFGAMEQATGDINQSDKRRLTMDVNDISNLDRNGQVRARDDRARLFGLGNCLWHSDSSFKTIPAKYSLLSARVIPATGGNTEFADMRAAWNTLPADLQHECRGLVCEHSQLYSRALLGFDDFTDEEREKWAAVSQPLIRQHPTTGQHSLFLSSHIGTITGWPVPEARVFIRDLTEHATRGEHVFTHQWTQWDLVMWDNRVTMHRARRYDHTQPRDLHRTTVAGDSVL